MERQHRLIEAPIQIREKQTPNVLWQYGKKRGKEKERNERRKGVKSSKERHGQTGNVRNGEIKGERRRNRGRESIDKGRERK